MLVGEKRGWFTKGWLPYLVILVAGSAALFPYIQLRPSTDEEIWIGNGIKFQQAVWQHNWPNTRLTTRPGVSVIWITALTARHVLGVDVLLNNPPDPLTSLPHLVVMDRRMIALTLLLLTLGVYALLTKLTSRQVALWSALLVSIHPIFTDHGYLTWLDMLLTLSMLVSLLAFLVFLSSRQTPYLLLTGLFFGVALLTKVIAWLVVAFLIIAILWLPDQCLRQRVRLLGAVGLVILLGLATFYLWYPAAWLDPGIIFDRTQEVTTTFTSPYAVPLEPHWWEYLVFTIIIDPIVAVLTLTTLYGLLKLWRQQQTTVWVSATLFSTAALYVGALYLVSFLKDVGVFAIRSDRYLAPIIPWLLIGTLHFFGTIEQPWPKRRGLTMISIVLLGYYYGQVLWQLVQLTK